MKTTCCLCGLEFERKASHARRGKHNFCSKECSDRHKERTVMDKMCKKVGMDFRDWLLRKYLDEMLSIRKISEILYGKSTSSSSVRRWLHKLDIPVRRGSEAIKTQWIDNDKRRKQQAEFIANIDRTNLYKAMQTEEYREKQRVSKLGARNGMYGVTGPAHPQWDESRTHEKRREERKTFEYYKWRLSVFNNDRYSCGACGVDRGGNLEAHHLNSHDKHPKERYLVENGKTLCQKCHKAFHSEYGYGNNTKEQYDEWYKKYVD